MRIIYIARHGCGGNQDEDAVTHGFESLGHSVQTVPEAEGAEALRLRTTAGDLLLFNKWYEPDLLRRLEGRIIRAFWYWDLVDWPEDDRLSRRCKARREWMQTILPGIDIGFMTDGDWVRKSGNGKLVKLEQGADGRLTDLTPVFSHSDSRFPIGKMIPILFLGLGAVAGVGRAIFVSRMQEKYGTRFRQVTHGVHGQPLVNLIASAAIHVAPDSPSTDHYWSNRVYLISGFGGFVLHPYSTGLARHYEDGKEIVFYESMEDLDVKIDYYLDHPEERIAIAEAGRRRTLAEHTYRHRCASLIETVRGRFFKESPCEVSSSAESV
jgi:hypothetical protein